MAFTYDYCYLKNSFLSLESNIKEVIQGNLTQKSFNRVEFIFKHINNKEFLDILFLNQKLDANLKIFLTNLEKIF